jgi:helix-turn-helix protein
MPSVHGPRCAAPPRIRSGPVGRTVNTGARPTAVPNERGGDDVTLIAPREHEAFERALYSAVLNQKPVAVKHPAVEGGVVRSTAWKKGRLILELGDGDGGGGSDTVALAVASGQFVEIYDQLVEAGVLEEQRTRRDVRLKARGRHIASEATDEE